MAFEDLMGANYKGECQTLKRLYKQNKRAFQGIQEQLSKNNLIPLFGAGFTRAAYPGWFSLLHDMADSFPNCQAQLDAQLNAGQFEEAASTLCAEMGEFEFQEELFQIFGPHTVPDAMEKLTPARKAIPRIFNGPMMTTNVDLCLEELYEHRVEVLCPHTDYHLPQADRSLQSAAPILFKLHGSVTDREHMVFTKEAYDTVYPCSQQPTPLSETLSSIFRSSPVLFLGCSLDTDRVVQVLNACCEHRSYFALVELPKETNNKNNPWEPLLVNDDGTENEAYRQRRLFMSKHHIQCIWYPCGKYEALDWFLQALLPPETPTPKKRSPIPALRRSLVGRDAFIQNLYEHCTRHSAPVFVTGVGGQGKTEVCHAVLRRLEEEGHNILYVSVTGIQSPALLCQAIAQRSGIPTLPDDKASDLPGYLDYLLDGLSTRSGAVLYLDNFEDVWHFTQKDDQLKVLEFLAQLCQMDLPVLLSSQVAPTSYDAPQTVYPLHTLNCSVGTDRKLFEDVYREKNGHLPLEGQAFETLLQQLDGHPLSIILTATLAAHAPSWDNVLERWTHAQQNTSNPRHTSLDTALQAAWDALSPSTQAIHLWGLIALYYGPLAYAQLMELAENEQERQRWEASIDQLCDACLVDWDDTGAALVMLQPVKEVFFLLAKPDDVVSCVLQWCNYYSSILEQANDRHHPSHQAAHIYVVNHRPQLLYLLERIQSPEWQEQLSPDTVALAKKIYNYLQSPTPQEKNTPEKLISSTPQQEMTPITSLISKGQNNLSSRTNQFCQIHSLYTHVESLVRQKRGNLELANTLKSRADLLSLTGQLPQALDLYSQAETLYRQEQDNLGLANTLKSRADLLSRTDQLSQALDLYAQAESLYRREQFNLDLANTLQSQADLLSRTGQLPQALDLYSQAESLFRQEHYNLGLANTLINKAFLYLDSDNAQALTLLFQALSLYESEHKPWEIALTCALLSRLCTQFEDQAHQAPALEQRAREIAETLPPTLQRTVLSILDDED